MNNQNHKLNESSVKNAFKTLTKGGKSRESNFDKAFQGRPINNLNSILNGLTSCPIFAYYSNSFFLFLLV